eukprot:2263805-Pleurochrysis_carterae.AAC.2
MHVRVCFRIIRASFFAFRAARLVCRAYAQHTRSLLEKRLQRAVERASVEWFDNGVVHPSVEAGGAAGLVVADGKQPDDAQPLALHDAVRLLPLADRLARLAPVKPKHLPAQTHAEPHASGHMKTQQEIGTP